MKPDWHCNAHNFVRGEKFPEQILLFEKQTFPATHIPLVGELTFRATRWLCRRDRKFYNGVTPIHAFSRNSEETSILKVILRFTIQHTWRLNSDLKIGSNLPTSLNPRQARIAEFGLGDSGLEIKRQSSAICFFSLKANN